MFSLRMLLLAASLALVQSYQMFQDQIPNGKNVPNPCRPGETWPGVGHLLLGGSGARNPFGLAFFRNEKVYNATLCRLDSDNDGKSNGAELGDPDCTWTVGSPSNGISELSHPGICEPLESARCQKQNDWLTCNPPFSCPAFDHPTTEKWNLTFPPTRIPPQETTYRCLGFRLPNDTAYHAIGFRAVLDNDEVMHHMLLYGCSQEVVLSGTELTTPADCEMSLDKCRELIGVWAVGHEGQCNADEFGFPIGTHGMRFAVLQIHWNNPTMASNIVDSSGMTMYYTSHLRPNDGMAILAGQLSLTIPPQQSRVAISGSCPSSCTALMTPAPLYITLATFHMHLLGMNGDVRVIRKGAEPVMLVVDKQYDYHTPKMNFFEKHIELRPGDEIQVNCVYNSLSRNTTTYWGESTHDEMCFSFIAMYPAVKGLTQCLQYKDVDLCSLNPDVAFKNDCNVAVFMYFVSLAQKYCDINCTATCRDIFTHLLDVGCLVGNVEEYLQVFRGLGELMLLKDYCMAGSNLTSVGSTQTRITSSPTMSRITSMVGQNNARNTASQKPGQDDQSGSVMTTTKKPAAWGNELERVESSYSAGTRKNHHLMTIIIGMVVVFPWKAFSLW